MFLFDFFRKRKTIKAPWSKYYSKEDLNFKLPDVSIYEQVKLSALKYPDAVAYEYFGMKYKYKKLIKEIDRAADTFIHYGVKKGEVVTICLPNIPAVLISLYALNKIGAVCNMLHPLSSENEILESLNTTHSSYLIMLDSFYNKIENIIYDSGVKNVIFCDVASHMNIFMGIAYHISQWGKNKKIPSNDMFITWNKLFFKYGYRDKNIEYTRYGMDAPCVILHSGGTSGKPKNVVIQNRAFILGAKQTGDICLNLKPGDCCLAIMPNFHGFGLSVCMHTPLTLGCYTILVPQFDAKKFDVLFNKTKPTCVLGVPTLFEALINCNNVKNLDLSYLKFLICGGDTLTKNLEDRINNYLRRHGSSAHIVQGYGLSEALAAVALGFKDVYKSGSIGIPLPGNHIKIIDPATRKTMPYGETGEICIHSKAYMSGYLDDESETNAALQVHKDGHIWLHTGDLGYMDKDGFVFYQGRSKRMIVSSGYNVYPSHVEEVIEKHPAVLQCSVVGIPHPYKQEVPKAFIVLKDGYHTIFVKNEIKEYCKKNLAKYMVPYEFVYRKKLPKTKLGKVDFMTLKNDLGADDDEE